MNKFLELNASHLEFIDSDFIRSVFHYDLGERGTVALFANFNEAHFKHSLFRDCNVICPSAIVCSADKRAADFLAGRLLSKVMISCLGVMPSDVPIGPNREPIWPKNMVGSISHSDGICVCVGSTQCQKLLGIDVEKIATGELFDGIIEACTTDLEKTLIFGSNTLDQYQLASLLFSAKETLFKALYPHIKRYFDFHLAEVIEIRNFGELQLTLKEDLAKDFPQDTRFKIGYHLFDNHVLTWLAARQDRMVK